MTVPGGPDASVTRGPAWRRILLILIRVAVAAVALRFALGQDPGRAIHALSEASIGWVGIAAIAMVVVVITSALRWRSYVRAVGLGDPHAPTVLRLTAIGWFFNAFLPTGIGGDAYKAMRLVPRGWRAQAAASVLLDRFSGLVGLAVVGLIAMTMDLDGVPRRLLLVAEAVAVAIVTATIVPRASREWILRRAHIRDRGEFGHALWRGAHAVATANRSLRVAARGYAWGVVSQAALLGMHLALARAIGISWVGVGVIAAAGVVAQVATLVPITINGLGLRESAYTWALVSADVPRDAAAAFALAVLALLLAASVAGGVVYLVAGGRVRPDAITPPAARSDPTRSRRPRP